LIAEGDEGVELVVSADEQAMVGATGLCRLEQLGVKLLVVSQAIVREDEQLVDCDTCRFAGLGCTRPGGADWRKGGEDGTEFGVALNDGIIVEGTAKGRGVTSIRGLELVDLITVSQLPVYKRAIEAHPSHEQVA
jgi:hypothetical protein